MKTTRPIIATLLLLTQAARAQNYAIDWHKVSGGGGTSSNAQYSLSGTMGQHDASVAIAGGTYTLTGGFWSIFALQSSSAPLLSIVATNGGVMVYWPAPSTGFNLQANTNLTTTSWQPPPEVIQTNGPIQFIMVTAPSGARFFRLAKP